MGERRKKLITVKLTPEVKDRLTKLKIHPRQPYDEVIAMLLDHYEKTKDKS